MGSPGLGQAASSVLLDLAPLLSKEVVALLSITSNIWLRSFPRDCHFTCEETEARTREWTMAKLLDLSEFQFSPL